MRGEKTERIKKRTTRKFCTQSVHKLFKIRLFLRRVARGRFHPFSDAKERHTEGNLLSGNVFFRNANPYLIPAFLALVFLSFQYAKLFPSTMPDEYLWRATTQIPFEYSAFPSHVWTASAGLFTKMFEGTGGPSSGVVFLNTFFFASGIILLFSSIRKIFPSPKNVAGIVCLLGVLGPAAAIVSLFTPDAAFFFVCALFTRLFIVGRYSKKTFVATAFSGVCVLLSPYALLIAPSLALLRCMERNLDASASNEGVAVLREEVRNAGTETKGCVFDAKKLGCIFFRCAASLCAFVTVSLLFARTASFLASLSTSGWGYLSAFSFEGTYSVSFLKAWGRAFFGQVLYAAIPFAPAFFFTIRSALNYSERTSKQERARSSAAGFILSYFFVHAVVMSFASAQIECAPDVAYRIGARGTLFFHLASLSFLFGGDWFLWTSPSVPRPCGKRKTYVSAFLLCIFLLYVVFFSFFPFRLLPADFFMAPFLNGWGGLPGISRVVAFFSLLSLCGIVVGYAIKSEYIFTKTKSFSVVLVASLILFSGIRTFGSMGNLFSPSVLDAAGIFIDENMETEDMSLTLVVADAPEKAMVALFKKGVPFAGFRFLDGFSPDEYSESKKYIVVLEDMENLNIDSEKFSAVDMGGWVFLENVSGDISGVPDGEWFYPMSQKR